MSILSRIGSIISPASSARKAITKNAATRAKYGITPGVRTTKKQAAENMSRAITKRQTAIGAGVVGVGAVGMMTRGRNSNSQRGGYRPPALRQPRGSGRYA